MMPTACVACSGTPALFPSFPFGETASRRVATRYDNLTANFLSGVALATAVAFWL
jgi:hypothetical protein